MVESMQHIISQKGAEQNQLLFMRSDHTWLGQVWTATIAGKPKERTNITIKWARLGISNHLLHTMFTIAKYFAPRGRTHQFKPENSGRRMNHFLPSPLCISHGSKYHKLGAEKLPPPSSIQNTTSWNKASAKAQRHCSQMITPKPVTGKIK
jgi:hypothetical protein